MKALLVTDRPTLRQRVAQIFERNGYEVYEASFEDDLMNALVSESFDLILLVAPQDEAAAVEFMNVCREMHTPASLYFLTSDGALAETLPRLQGALGRRLSVNDLPAALREEITRAKNERQHIQLEQSRETEKLVEIISTATTVREAVKQIVEHIKPSMDCRTAAVILVGETGEAAAPVAIAGDAKPLSNTWEKRTTIFQWLIEAQSPLVIRRGRSTITGIQREIVQFGLGPCAFVPITTTQRLVGFLAVEQEPNAIPLSDADVSTLKIAASVLAIRIESDQITGTEEIRQILHQEREERLIIEESLGEVREMLQRLAREVGIAVEMRRGQHPGQCETIAGLADAVADQLDFPMDYLKEAVYLRDIGALVLPELSVSSFGGQPSQATENALVNAGFQILARIGMPPVCIEVVRHHRENFDGSGFPDGLKGEQIPRLARVVRVVEDYVNMTTTGQGQGPLLSPDALASIMKNVETLYDPDVANRFVGIVRAQGTTPEQQTLSLISHELRTPLAFLAGFSELLAARNDLPEQAKQMATELQKQTEQMVTLTERLLELTRLQSGRMSLSWQSVNLGELIEEQVTKARALSSAHTFVVNVSPLRIRADRTRLAQVVNNLLNNAVKYSPKGGKITVTMDEGADEVVVRVSDQGLGIPVEKQERLFQPFYRVQQPETQKIEGLGLGLAITQAIVSAHGGKIWVESEPGAGSTFSFTLNKQEAPLGAMGVGAQRGGAGLS